jgi:hypothetical protein
MDGECYLTLKNLSDPPAVGSYRLDKIFSGIPAGSSDFTHVSVRHCSFPKSSVYKFSV